MILKTFTEFVNEVCEEFPAFTKEIQERATNITSKEHAGHSDNLYIAEFGCWVVTYNLNKKYAISFSSCSSEGETPSTAYNDFVEAYDTYCNSR
jgi:hypothetical protein